MEEMENQKVEYKSLKSEIFLPIIFALTLTIAILFIAEPSFKEDLEAFVIWVFCGSMTLYTGASIFDLVTKKNRSKGKKIYLGIISGFVIVSIILYIVFYLIG